MREKALRYLDAGVEYAVYGIIFFIPISIAMVSSLAVLVLVCFLLKKIIDKDFSALKNNRIFFLYLLIFFIFMSLSLFHSGALIGKSLKALLLKWGRWPLLLWAILDVFNRPRRVTKAMAVFIFSAALVGLSACAQKFLGFEFLRWKPSGGYFATPTGPFKNPNALSAYLTCLIPVFLGVSLYQWKRIFLKILFILATCTLMAVSLWTNTRGGWLGIMLGLFYIIVIISGCRLKKTLPFLLPISLFFYIASISGFISLYAGKLDSHRFLLFQGSWKMIQDNPFLGKGVGTYMDYSTHYINNFGACYAHNCYLQMWAETGIFALLSFFLFMGYIFYRSIKASLRMPKTLDFFVLISFTAGMLGFLAHSFFEVHLYSFQLSFIFWILLGLSVSLSTKFLQDLSLDQKRS